ncbi:hypothetical protein HYH03_013641 [Edaphochlamys debaryana]|uniref:Peptidase S8/S53 domain-containing protein n=1 Tax=Edaphochlamys debaryana TaxID=47281 RepID=A0A836BT68_9CHLO|nr:hypothetical protein HYH03_013641 [Edaphochlamys debaryana]|eukprot:KAG2487797.1 hypothetical protein HYH03_013641 [Edaphochlamys debaryana]
MLGPRGPGRPPLRGPALAVALLGAAALLCTQGAAEAEGITSGSIQPRDFVELRSGRVGLRPAEDGVFPSSDAGSSAPPRLFLVRFREGTVGALRDDLVRLGSAQILSFADPSTVLVYAAPAAVATYGSRHGVLVAEYHANLKMSPEAVRVAEAAAQEVSRRRRRAAEVTSLEPAEEESEEHLFAPGSPLHSVQAWHPNTAGSASFRLRSLFTSAGPDVSPPPLLGTAVQIVASVPHATLQELTSSMMSGLAAALGRTEGASKDPCWPHARDEALHGSGSGFGWLHVYMCPEDMEPGLAWLAARHEVSWVKPLSRQEPHNAVAGWIIQSGGLTRDLNLNTTSRVRPYWQAGIMGNREIVGVTDTGVDLKLCAFYDDVFKPYTMINPLVVPNATDLKSIRFPEHRKIVQYTMPSSANFGDSAGHGTASAASIAGSTSLLGDAAFRNELSTGAAPMARLSVFQTVWNSGNLTYSVPTPPTQKILPFHTSAGARIGSDSWGNAGLAGTAYDDTASAYDAFAWRDSGWLSVVAAGNQGINVNLRSTVSSPANAKNTLAVGSSLAQVAPDINSYAVREQFVFLVNRSTAVPSPFHPYSGPTGAFAQWATRLSTLVPARVVDVIPANPVHACTALVGGNATFSGKVVLVNLAASAGATCTNPVRATNVAAVGAVAILFMRDSDELLPVSPQAPITVNFKSVLYAYITRSQGQKLLNDTAAFAPTTPVRLYYYNDTRTSPVSQFGINAIADTSSYGPTADGRIKPDLVAPGQSLVTGLGTSVLPSNTLSGTSCFTATSERSGTSLAAAATAGHLAMMRQYFRDGYYPEGSINGPSSANFTPSGMLLKAVAVAGAEDLRSGYARNRAVNMGSAPDGMQGWGRLDLSGSLPLTGVTPPGMRLQVADGGTIRANETISLRGIRASANGTVTAVLVWNDYPASPTASTQLVNDLDLKYELNGNGTRFPVAKDSVNNVERLRISVKAGDTITFHIIGARVTHSTLTVPDAQLPQRWAFVVVGQIRGILETTLNPSFVIPPKFQASGPVALGPPFMMRLGDGRCGRSINGSLIASTNCYLGADAIFRLSEMTSYGEQSG